MVLTNKERTRTCVVLVSYSGEDTASLKEGRTITKRPRRATPSSQFSWHHRYQVPTLSSPAAIIAR
jgi:hypothetical protein